MKIIHVADLHLDSKLSGFSSEFKKLRKLELLTTFERLVNYAKENNVEKIIIAGDMFDSTAPNKKTLERVISIITNASDIEFLYLKGNHDEFDVFEQLTMPINFKTLNDLTTYNYSNLTITGITDFSKCPLLNLPENTINIVVMHGELLKYNNKNYKGEKIPLKQLENKNINYIALGHYHTFTESTLDSRGVMVYSGCLEGRGFDECGEKGFVLIEITDSLSYQFIPFAYRNLYEETIDVSSYDNFYEVECAVKEIVNKLNYPPKSLFKLNLVGKYSASQVKDLTPIQQFLDSKFDFAKIKDETFAKIELESLVYEKSLKGEFLQLVASDDSLSELEKSEVISIALKALAKDDL